MVGLVSRLVTSGQKCEHRRVSARSLGLLTFHLGAVAIFAVACGGDQRAPNPPAITSAASSAAPPPRDTDSAYRLVVASAACWLGGLWVDAEGESGASERRAGTARRCAEVVRAVSGEDDPSKVEALRVLDPPITDALVVKVKERARADGKSDSDTLALENFATAVVSASREATMARRVATKIRADIEKLKTDKEKAQARDRDAERLSADEASAVPSLRASAGLERLLDASAGDYARDAHAIGVMLALTRVRSGQDLPKHMKLYAVSPAYAAVFATKPPSLPEHARDRLKPGTWLAYVVRVAAACGHPVPDSAKTAKEKEALAWAGGLAGLADRLEADESQIKNPDLLEAVRGAVERLQARSKGLAP